MTSAEYVTLLYERLLDRKPDANGLAYYVAILDSTGDLKGIIDSFVGGDEYKSRFSPQPSPDTLTSATQMDRPLVIVDVGAQKLADEDHIYAPLLAAGLDWRCIGFEPLEEELEERMRSERDPRLIMLNAFVGDGKQHVFRISNDTGSSSLLQLNHKFISSFEHISTLHITHEESIESKKLDDLLSGENYVDFLKFDIQGFENRALGGAIQTLMRTNVIHCECFFGPMYLDQGFFADIDLVLRSAGFDFIDFSHLARYRYIDVPRPSASGERLIWADAVYFRQLDRVRDPASCFQAQSMIADLIYRKPGLAQKILRSGVVETG